MLGVKRAPPPPYPREFQEEGRPDREEGATGVTATDGTFEARGEIRDERGADAGEGPEDKCNSEVPFGRLPSILKVPEGGVNAPARIAIPTARGPSKYDFFIFASI
jgi:hypothetical protein